MTEREKFEKETGANTIHDGQLSYFRQYSYHLESKLSKVRDEYKKVAQIAQAVLTALNTGHIYKESLLHKELRKVMIILEKNKS